MAKLSDDALAYFRSQGARGGKKSSRRMTAAERTARASKAGQAAAAKQRAKMTGKG